MNDIFIIIALLGSLLFAPPAIGYYRRLSDRSMLLIWLWLALPVIGWIVSLATAIGDNPPKHP